MSAPGRRAAREAAAFGAAAFAATLSLGALAASCGGEPPLPAAPPRVSATMPPSTAPPPPAPSDVLGPRPPVAPAPPYAPPVPVVYTRANGMTVWLVERHALPIVSVEVVVPSGAAEDGTAKSGLAFATAGMLDEGAGARGALDIARDVDRLGATLHTGAFADYSFVQLTTLKKNLAPAASILGDVLGKPTFLPVEWQRVHDLWLNDLKQRASDPSAVANVVVSRKVLENVTHSYALPTNGTTKTAAAVTLDDVKKHYADTWIPRIATCVVVGDVTRAELDPLLDTALAGWTSSRRKGTTQPNERQLAGRRVFVVDRPDAPQSVIAVGRRGAAASDPETPALARVNGALGGSFTSRLNQDLREEHGWSYGAKSRFSFNRLPGIFVAQAAVQTAHTGDALKAMLADIEAYAKDGPTDDEVEKTRLLARADLVEAFESVDAAAHRLARNAGVGLGADHEAKSAAAMYGATKDDLKRLAASHVDASNAVVVIVGPRAKILPQLEAIGITKVESAGPEGE